MHVFLANKGHITVEMPLVILSIKRNGTMHFACSQTVGQQFQQRAFTTSWCHVANKKSDQIFLK